MVSVANKHAVMTLYSDPMCPHSHRCRMVLAEKGVNVDIIDVNSDHPTSDLIDINPYQTLPTLVDRDLVLYKSRIITEYLDERFPHPPLLPVYPVARARARLMIHRIDADWYSLAQAILKGTKSEQDKARRELPNSIKRLAPVFNESTYFLSDEYSLMDCALAALFWRLPVLGIELKRLGQGISRYAQHLFERNAFQISLSAAERSLGE